MADLLENFPRMRFLLFATTTDDTGLLGSKASEHRNSTVRDELTLIEHRTWDNSESLDLLGVQFTLATMGILFALYLLFLCLGPFHRDDPQGLLAFIHKFKSTARVKSVKRSSPHCKRR